jgi:aromatic ring hydroxylase
MSIHIALHFEAIADQRSQSRIYSGIRKVSISTHIIFVKRTKSIENLFELHENKFTDIAHYAVKKKTKGFHFRAMHRAQLDGQQRFLRPCTIIDRQFHSFVSTKIEIVVIVPAN